MPQNGSYRAFAREVRRYRLESVLNRCADVGALLSQAARGKVRFHPPKYVSSFTLAAVADAALVTGTEHRRAEADRLVVQRLCALVVDIDDPDLTAGPDATPRGLMSRLSYQQLGFHVNHHDEVARAVGLLLEHLPAVPGAPASADWEQLLGVPLETYLRVVFAVFVAAVENPASVTRSMLLLDHVRPIFAPASRAEVMHVVDRWLAAAVREQRTWALDRRTAGRELWSPNPLQHRPLVSVGDHLIAPVPEYILGRMRPTGLWFIGVEAFGSRFTDAFGHAFEAYVGEQLRLISAATIYPEVVYGSPEQKTVDWFVVTEEAVVLVEVKATRAPLSVRTGAEAGDEHARDRIGHARDQVDRTAALLAEDHPAVRHVPKDRPVRGLVVTLEPWHLVDTFFYDGVLPVARTPTATASAHDIELVCASLAGRPDGGQRLLDALTPTAPVLRRATQDLPNARNPLLDRWYGQWRS